MNVRSFGFAIFWIISAAAGMTAADFTAFVPLLKQAENEDARSAALRWEQLTALRHWKAPKVTEPAAYVAMIPAQKVIRLRYASGETVAVPYSHLAEEDIAHVRAILRQQEAIRNIVEQLRAEAGSPQEAAQPVEPSSHPPSESDSPKEVAKITPPAANVSAACNTILRSGAADSRMQQRARQWLDWVKPRTWQEQQNTFEAEFQQMFQATDDSWWIVLLNSNGQLRNVRFEHLAEEQQRGTQLLWRLAYYIPHDAQKLNEGGTETLIDEAIGKLLAEEYEDGHKLLLRHSNTYKNCMRADFVMGLIHLLLTCNPRKAEEHFRTCTARERDHIAAWNNRMVAAIKIPNWAATGRSMETLMKIAPQHDAFRTNLLRLSELAENETVALPLDMKSALSRAVQQSGASRMSSRDGQLAQAGWYILPDDSPVSGGPYEPDALNRDAELITRLGWKVRSEQTSLVCVLWDSCLLRKGILLDVWCLRCDGSGQERCSESACRGGATRERGMEWLGANPITGQKIGLSATTRTRCSKCAGTGWVACKHCTRGVDSRALVAIGNQFGDFQLRVAERVLALARRDPELVVGAMVTRDLMDMHSQSPMPRDALFHLLARPKESKGYKIDATKHFLSRFSHLSHEFNAPEQIRRSHAALTSIVHWAEERMYREQRQ
ncbi:MAG: hypothetical protein RBS80_27995 [Thermoguttaceae bacterium]|jgi:hypothetical protein|nr:hypothetical protein [Thermoguttaceae bacterium]